MTKSYFPDLFGPFEEEDSAQSQAWNQKRMAKKGYRAPKKVSKNKLRTVTNSKSKAWPNLPHQLIRMISKQVCWQYHGLSRQEGGLLHSVSFDGVAKTWRSASRQCCNKQQFPWLDLISTQESLDITHYVYSIPETLWSNAWWCRKYKRMTNEDSIIGCSHGELLMKSLTNKVEYSYYLWSPPGSSMWLPQFPEGVSFGQIVLSSSPDYRSRNCTVLVLTRGSRAGFMFCKISRTNCRWIEEECTLLDPNSSRSNPCTIQFTNAVALDGKFYTLSLQGTLAVIDTDSIDPAPRVTILCAKRAIPSTWSRSFKEYLVESCGEILLVFLISTKTVGIVDDIEVLRLNFHTRSWERMVSLGDRTFFVGLNCFMAVCSSELGCRANCIYFTQAMKHGWWVFDLEGGTISEGWNGNSTDKSPIWDVPVVEQMDMIL